MSKGNVIVGQSGGPTSVINASLAGVYDTARKNGTGRVFGMLNGIQGLLAGRYIDMGQYVGDQVELLKRTPSSYLGSCRYKLPSVKKAPEAFEQIFARLKEWDIKHFFYIGGNDSMDTINKLNEYAVAHGIKDITFMGVPKTVDNDLPITDHTPGFGSAAKYIGTTLKELICDSKVYPDIKLAMVVEIMGRNAGWLAAAASLAKDQDCDGADMILLPETVFCEEKFNDRMADIFKKKNSVLIAVSEGVKTADGRYVCDALGSCAKDAFGHATLGGTAAVLANQIKSKFGAKVRPIELSSIQRCAAHISSLTDVNEAFGAGEAAVKAAFAGISGKMPVFIRKSDNPYVMNIELTDVKNVANVEKKVPDEWIINDGTYVSNDVLTYMRPLIQGECAPIMENGIPRHLVLKI